MSAIDVGDRLPEFELPDQSGQTIRSAELIGRGPLVVFFYPRDETPGCTVEACTFRDAHAELAEAGATVVGISSDGVESHKRFATKHQLPYSLLADDGGRVRDRFGVPRSLFGLSDGRVTYIADKGGVVRHRFVGMFQAARHVSEALDAVKKLR
jgi:peroxiredoxin Q/BCP